VTSKTQEDADGGLILAAEECPPDKFEQLHAFSSYDDVIIRKLSAHGPVLIRGGRGSGKSALLIEAQRRMRAGGSVFSVYMSLRYLSLLQSDGDEYIGHFCGLLSNEIARELTLQGLGAEFPVAKDQVTLQLCLGKLSQTLDRRIVLLFDDAAHIGREKPLEVFFDLFRTLSSSVASCKASIYPGVTKFGVRFDVFNDSTVLDISRSTVLGSRSYFLEVIKSRYPRLATRDVFSDRLFPEQFANLLGRAVVGNMRAFILACNRFDEHERISIPDLNTCFLDMATDYYWPLMEEVAPKLGVYEPLIEPAGQIFEAILENVSRPLRSGAKMIAQDRVTVHGKIVGNYAKIFEILEYLGFMSKIQASRGMKSGGRGPVYAINLCSLLEKVPSKRLTIEMIDEWIDAGPDLAEIHSGGNTFDYIEVPVLPEEHSLGILEKSVDVLAKSKAYPYGLTEDKIARLKAAGIKTVQELANTTDNQLYAIDMVGEVTIKRMRNVTLQAIWM
jgi:hypothetical protein